MICNETRIINFLLACFKKLKCLMKLIFEFDLQLPSGEKIIPDLFCYFNYISSEFYSIFELKQININPIPNDQFLRIKNQYHNYLKMTTEDIDDTLMPKNLSAEIYINYLILDSLIESVEEIINNIPIRRDTNIFTLDFEDKIMNSLQITPDSPNSKLLEKIIEYSRDHNYWIKVYLPFTFRDIEEVKGGGGNEVKIPRTAGIIITNSLMTFVISRKIREENSNFSSEDFIEYIYKEAFDNLVIGREMRRAFTKKIKLCLTYISDILINEMEITPIIIRLGVNQFQIILRRTETLITRCEEIQNKIIGYLAQTRITEFIVN